MEKQERARVTRRRYQRKPTKWGLWVFGSLRLPPPFISHRSVALAVDPTHPHGQTGLSRAGPTTFPPSLTLPRTYIQEGEPTKGTSASCLNVTAAMFDPARHRTTTWGCSKFGNVCRRRAENSGTVIPRDLSPRQCSNWLYHETIIPQQLDRIWLVRIQQACNDVVPELLLKALKAKTLRKQASKGGSSGNGATPSQASLNQPPACNLQEKVIAGKTRVENDEEQARKSRETPIYPPPSPTASAKSSDPSRRWVGGRAGLLIPQARRRDILGFF
ncbi:hypothetical protein EV426DRAFT_705967 [Tirmania nivea]|nr:hypothetical protein EV426DRAFT_705967 [Tirmania nivea]